MNRSIVLQDLRRNKTTNGVLIFFVMLGAFLAVASCVIAIEAITSISSLYEKAQPPHFVQMHKGELDLDEIEAFIREEELVVSG